MRRPDISFSTFFSSYICRWRNLQTVLCGDVTLDVNAFVHLSRMPALSQLAFTLSPPLLNQTIPSNLPLSFPSLHEFVLYSICLDPISQLLSRIKLPAVMDFTAFIEHRPSQLDLSIFISTIRTSGIGHTIQGLQLDQGSKHILAEALKHVLCFQDLQPCTKFRILRRLNLNFEWHVELTDSELLMLASAWPHLEHLIINPDWGWKTQGGITPNGLVQLLKRCRALSQVALAIDTQGYTESPPPRICSGHRRFPCVYRALPQIYFLFLGGLVYGSIR
ncbi:hypothetical protein V8E55_004336 [Tylopilus felleus]